MDDRHVIGEAVIDVSFDCEEEAFEQQAALSVLARSRLMEVVEEVFDELSPAGVVCRIESLEIDLGVMDAIGLPEEMERRLRERLRLVLQEQLQSLHAEPAPRSRIVTQPRAELEQLAQFLISGRLTWNANLGKGRTMEQMLLRVLHSSGAQLAEFLRRSPHGVTAVQRLVRQFPDERLSEVLQALAPSHATALARLVDDLRTAARASGSVTAGEAELRRFIWESLIHELRQGDGSGADPKTLLGRLVNGMAVHEGGSYSQMLTALVAGAAQVERRMGRRLALSGLLQHLINEGQQGHRVAGTWADAGRSSEIEVLRQRLAEALARGTGEAIRDIWPRLLREQPALLRAALRQQGQQARVRRQLARNFPELMIRDILTLLEPTESRFIEDIVGRPQFFAAPPGEAPEPQARRQRQLWEFTLTYLLVERGSRFNRRAYLGSLLRQMAAHDNLRARDLLRALTDGVAHTPAPAALKDELLRLLGELAADLRREPSPTVDDDAPSKDLIRAADLYDALSACVLQGLGERDQGLGARDQGPEGEEHVAGGVSALIEALEQEAPWQFLRLYRELQAGFRGGQPVAARLSAGELHRLLMALLTVMPQAGTDGRAALIRAIDSYAGRARDAKRLYGRILENVLRDESIDFDALLAEDQLDSRDVLSSEEAEGRERVTRALGFASPERAGDMNDEPAWEASRARSVQRRLAEALERGSGEAIRDIWPRLLREQPALLRAALRQQGQQARVRRQLARNFPELMIRDILTLLEPMESRFIEDIVGRPQLFAAPPGEAPEPQARRQRQLWEFTLTYLLVERGSRFNRRAYLGSLLRQMAAHDNLRAPDLLRTLAEGVAHTPAPAALKDEMLELLGELARDLSHEEHAASELHRLLVAVLALMPQAGADGHAALLRAIDTYAGRARDPRRLYRQVLAHLLRHEPIDFDALLAENLSGGKAEDELIRYLKEGGPVSGEEAARLIRTIQRLLAQQPARLRHLAESLLESRAAAERLIDLLPERLLTRVLALLRPSVHDQAQRCAELLATACAGLASAAEPGRLRRLKWQFLFRHLLEEGRPFDQGAFVRRCAAFLAGQLRWRDATEFRTLLSQHLALTTLPSTRDRHRAMIEALAETVEAKPLPGTASTKTKLSDLTESLEEEERDYREQIYIANAGLVLAAPYVPRLFGVLNLTEGSAFLDRNAAERAVHLLQFMVNERTESPEYQLVLNKILCGVRTGIPIERSITISDREKETIEGLLRAMIQNWKSLGNTSIAGLRESFLQREGRLQLRENAWHLLVEPRAFDMLLDQVPWSFSVIKHPWMERVVHVEWR